jgi:hypothetical protein
VIVTGTDWDFCRVCVFWTCSWAVPGFARLLVTTVPDNVFASTAAVDNGAPFQRMAAWVGKFVPVTLRVIVWEPAAMVCGETWLILGVSATGCCGVADCVVFDAQPRQ